MTDSVSYVDLPAALAPLRERFHAALDRVLDHGQLVLGPEVGQLERRLAARLGAPHVVTCGSGTDALMLALRLRGVGPGDEVVTTAHSFIATANAIAAVGATPVFADIDDATMCLDPARARAAITAKTRAIVVVHLNGYPCDVAPLESLCADAGLALIEDCAQAFGAARGGICAGATGTGCFSFHPLKVLPACGDGGCVTVASADDAAALRSLRNHGLIDRDTCTRVGVNARLDSLQAGFLLAALGEVDGWLAARRAHAAGYRAGLAGLVALPPDEPDVAQTYSAFVVRHPDRDRIRAALAAAGIDVKVHYPIPIHRQAPYAAENVRLPVTERVVDEIVSLPIGAHVTAAARERVIAAITKAVEAVA